MENKDYDLKELLAKRRKIDHIRSQIIKTGAVASTVAGIYFIYKKLKNRNAIGNQKRFTRNNKDRFQQASGPNQRAGTGTVE